MIIIPLNINHTLIMTWTLTGAARTRRDNAWAGFWLEGVGLVGIFYFFFKFETIHFVWLSVKTFIPGLREIRGKNNKQRSYIDFAGITLEYGITRIWDH